MRIANDLTQAIDYDEVAAKRDQCVCEIIDHSIQLNVVVNSVATPVKFILLAKTVSQQPYRSAAIDPIATLRKRLLTTKTSTSIPELLQTAIGDASEKFYQYQQQNTTGNKIGVSILLAAIVEQGEQGEQAPHLYINHLGSCRAYLLRKGKLHPLTADHSYIRFLLDTGGASWETANKHSGKAELTNYLGLNRYEKGDANLITPPEDGEVWSYRTKVNQQPTQSLKLEVEDKLIFVTSDPTDDGSKIRQVVEKSPDQAVNELLQQSITAAAIVNLGKPKSALRKFFDIPSPAKPQSQVASSSGRNRGVGITALLGLLGALLVLGIWAILPPPPPPTTPTAPTSSAPATATPNGNISPTATETITPSPVTITPATATETVSVAKIIPTSTINTPVPSTPTLIPTATNRPAPQETVQATIANPTEVASNSPPLSARTTNTQIPKLQEFGQKEFPYIEGSNDTIKLEWSLENSLSGDQFRVEIKKDGTQDVIFSEIISETFVEVPQVNLKDNDWLRWSVTSGVIENNKFIPTGTPVQSVTRFKVFTQLGQTVPNRKPDDDCNGSC